MTECRFAGTNQPRIIPARHTDDCHDDQCRGCQPCDRGHCRICGIAHTTGTCPECMAETRETLREIARLCDALPEEVEHRGAEGEAMFLLGPAADPEARGHLEASVRAGRISPDYLADAIGETHPVWVLGTWEMAWRSELEHDDGEKVTLAEATRYLDEHMSQMGAWPWIPFEDFARDLRRCRTHLEAVLHDGEQIDKTRVPCLDCGAMLLVKYAHRAADDHHACPKCRRIYAPGDFSIAKAGHLASEPADRFVPISDAAQAVERSQFTIRTWIKREVVRSSRSGTGRLLVWWPDVRDENRKRKIRQSTGRTA
jgi:hypothetical protein